jgi:hypothetical protein
MHPVIFLNRSDTRATVLSDLIDICSLPRQHADIRVPHAVSGRPFVSALRFSSSVMVLKSSLCYLGKMRSVRACAAVATDGSRSLGRICVFACVFHKNERARRSRAGLEERAVCSGRLKRKGDTLLPLLEHAVAYLNEFHVRFNVGLQIL